MEKDYKELWDELKQHLVATLEGAAWVAEHWTHSPVESRERYAAWWNTLAWMCLADGTTLEDIYKGPRPKTGGDK